MILTYFKDIDFLQAIKRLFKELKVPMNYVADESTSAQEILKDTYKDNSTFALVNEVYFVGMVDGAAFEQNESLAIDKIKSDYDGVLIFGTTLNRRENNLLPTRSQLAEISRAFNREFYYTPVLLVFKYKDDDADYIAFANTERLKYKQEWREGEKAGKVSLLRDINIQKPHRGHEDIINQLKIPTSGKNKVDSFAKLYTYWQEVFNVSILNKKFYNELQTWYFWALKEVRFPNEPGILDEYIDGDEVKLQEAIKEHKGKNVIRLLTRILFIWFIKEKKLIPEEIFDEQIIADKLIDDFTPQKPLGVFATGKHNSKYYRAILQNLFFATLNQQRGKREFRKDKQHQNVTNLMRYEDYFKDPEYFVQLMEDVVPFMNGGLFECLDKPHPTARGKQGGEIIIYSDGFSDRTDNTLVVPDYLFFDIDEDVDISEEIGINTKTYKNTKTRGLLKILKDYKFTITENTPIEEDVALDPELLGKVFENLLASYNPETKTTARKQTGSFYTPREIVNYMVDESLIAYLKNNILNEDEVYQEMGSSQTNLLGNEGKVGQLGLTDKIGKSKYGGTTEQLDKDLHQLFSFDTINPFAENDALQKQIIKALDKCTILDPACGSGAFPMGALQKMVHVLHKVDPNGQDWKQRQINKVDNQIELAEEIEDSQFRERNIKDLELQKQDIKNAFENNELDYGRKLFLIENCIYGVDIQSIATQISKLRFFISLVVDQKIDSKKDNFGVRPLPNLETKFVAANTLIGIDKPSNQLSLYDTPEVKTLEKELKKIRHKLFSAKTKDTKLKYRQKDEELRNAIAEELIKSGWANNTAEKLASWDPYDQNASSPFFDPEWMFDIKDGFDVVIGNPPWGAKLSKDDKLLFKKTYPNIDSSTPNSFAYFIGEAMIHSSGIISYTLPDSILIKDFKKTRKLLKDNLFEISWYLNTGIPEEFKPFVYVEHDVCVLLINKKREPTQCRIKKHLYDLNNKKIDIQDYSIKKNDFIRTEHDFSYNLKIQEAEVNLYKEIMDLPILDKILQCHEGIHTGNSRELLFNKKFDDGNIKPLFYGGRAGDKIENYQSKTSGWLVDYRKEIINKDQGFYASLRDERIFKFPKIFITRTGNPLKAFYDENTYASNNFFSLQFEDYSNNSKDKLKRILPLILSKFANYFIRTFAAPRLGDTFIETKIFHILKIPYTDLLLSSKELNNICSLIINCIDQGVEYKFLQEISDSIIFNLYFPGHMQEKEIDVLQFIEKDIAVVMRGRDFENLSDIEKEAVIEQLHKTWSHPDNEVRNRIKLFAISSPDILKTILES